MVEWSDKEMIQLSCKDYAA